MIAETLVWSGFVTRTRATLCGVRPGQDPFWCHRVRLAAPDIDVFIDTPPPGVNNSSVTHGYLEFFCAIQILLVIFFVFGAERQSFETWQLGTCCIARSQMSREYSGFKGWSASVSPREIELLLPRDCISSNMHRD